MKLIHAADIHLDSALRGLGRIGEEHADEVRRATRRALENLVELVLAESGVEMVMVSRNYDAASQITRSLGLPPHVRRLDKDAPESVFFDNLGVVVHCQSYARRDVQENLAAAFPSRVPGLVNVGLLHTSAAGYDGHKTYAPCSREDLAGLCYHHTALGHIHQRQAVVDGDHPAWFSGNLQGRHARETGPRGAWWPTSRSTVRLGSPSGRSTTCAGSGSPSTPPASPRPTTCWMRCRTGAGTSSPLPTGGLCSGGSSCSGRRPPQGGSRMRSGRWRSCGP